MKNKKPVVGSATLCVAGSRSAKPVVGFFSFTGCEGCGFTVLFLDELSQLIDKLDIEYFNLIKEKNPDVEFDLAFVEGAITTTREIEKLKKIRAKSKFLVAMGACSCHGGIPAMRNFIENKELEKYTYNQKMLEDSIDAQPIDKFIKVDYYMYGCPILKTEFMEFINSYLNEDVLEQFNGPVCNQCPKRGKDCFLREKTMCLGAVTRGGCDAVCLKQNIPCIMCRGPLESANFPAEVALFRSWGVSDKDIINKIGRFGKQRVEKVLQKNVGGKDEQKT